MRSLLSNTSNSISWPIRDEHCSSPPITAHLDRVRVVGGGDCSTCSSCSCPRRGGHVHLQFFNFLLQKCRSAEYLQFFTRYIQKCRVSLVLHVIICCRGTQWDSWFCNISGCGAARMTSYKSNVTTGRSCTKTAKFKFAPDRCSDRGANQQLQNAVTLLTNPIY